jgi:archaellum component FlaC
MIERYAEIYDLIKKQQEKWLELAEELKDNYENLSEQVDYVSDDFIKIFTIVDK